MSQRSFLLGIVGLLVMAAGLCAPRSAAAAEEPSSVPSWLRAHVGEGDGQIAPVVLQRARALYRQKVREGVVRNPCYFAMDATRPNDLGNGEPGLRFYVVCESAQSFRAISAGHGSGRDLKGVANFVNGRECAKNFGNALDSELTAGGAYVTREIKTTFKGYYRVTARQDAAFVRSFVQFDGEGETANARERAIGGHASSVLGGLCRRRSPDNPHANHDGYVSVGKLVDYTGGRSDGCTSWSPTDAAQLMPMIRDNPTSLYIYPESRDIEAVARIAAAGGSPASAGAYWNASCLRQIGAPRFWSNETLGPIIARYKRERELQPHSPPHPLPICTEP